MTADPKYYDIIKPGVTPNVDKWPARTCQFCSCRFRYNPYAVHRQQGSDPFVICPMRFCLQWLYLEKDE